MTITISRATESLLKKRAIEEGFSEDELADSILFRGLTADESNSLADVEAIREAIEQERQGKYRPFAEYVAEHKTRYPRHPS